MSKKSNSMNLDKSFESFFNNFVQELQTKELQFNKAVWILETTGSKDAADLVASLDNEYKILFSDKDAFNKIKSYKEKTKSPLLLRQLDVLIKDFKANLLPKDMLKEISDKEAVLTQIYANFRSSIDGKKVSENEIRDILKEEKSIPIRKKAWEASKEIGVVLAPRIIELVKIRNSAAKYIGYENYFDMMLDLNDVNKKRLFKIFNDLKKQTDDIYLKVLHQVNETLSKDFNISIEQLGLWAWKDPFCQIDPIEPALLNNVFENKDILAITKSFYEKMGFNVDNLIKASDLYERKGKNQHAFCISMDRRKDVRTLNNIKPNVQWMDTLLHEFGHAVYDLSINEKTPWVLSRPPHVLTTEAIALLMGRQVYTKEFLQEFCNISDPQLFEELEKGIKRRQLFFSRSVFLITEFENEMYKDPDQDLNNLWWNLFEKYYSLPRPKNRENKADWAAKYHIGLAPVYYYSYLLGEVLASTLQKELKAVAKQNKIWQKNVGEFLKEKMFSVGSVYTWEDLIKHVTKKPFSCDAWIEDCSN